MSVQRPGLSVIWESHVPKKTMRRQDIPPDIRSTIASEEYAFRRLGLGSPIVTESELVSSFAGCRVPEGIFIDPVDPERRVSVEVKRIVGGHLPDRTHPRRVLRRHTVRGGDEIIWPWTSSVETALSKLDASIASNFDVRLHHAVFLTPQSMNARTRRRTQNHIDRVARSFLSHANLNYRVRIHVFTCEDSLFYRL